MKPGPIIAMIVLVFLGMWLVLQPALARSDTDFTVSVGAIKIMLDRTKTNGNLLYEVVAPANLRTGEQLNSTQLDALISEQFERWNDRPALERHLLGFFNISTWRTFGFVAIGLIGQGAFFGRMFVQWIVSERSQVSTVPEIFWWFSFVGGICLFIYFVWRVDIVGVMGQSTGIVIYARNLRLIHKAKKRSSCDHDESDQQNDHQDDQVTDSTSP